jgi:hypothetical protein
MKDKESLETRAAVGELADAIENEVDNLLSNGVMATSVVVSRILLSRDNLLRMVKLAIGSMTDFVAHRGLEINVHSTRDVTARASLAEEGVESVVSKTKTFVRGHRTIRLDAMFEAVQLPAVVTSLNTSLAQVDRDAF